MNAIDTNVLAYTFDPADPDKQAKACQLVFDLVSKPPKPFFSTCPGAGKTLEGILP